MKYSTIVRKAIDEFPELYDFEQCRFHILEAEEMDNLPYIFFPALWNLLKITLESGGIYSELRNRIFHFMEEMAKSGDLETINLVQIEMLEPIFGLDYEIYHRTLEEYLLPECLKLHEMNKLFFREPVKK